MNKLIKGIKRLALALCLATPIVSWAGLPTITVTGNDVTISFDSGSYGNIGTNNGGSDTITIPVATDLAEGTVLRVKSISLGSRTGGTASPASITVAGVDSDAAVVTEDVYESNRDKYTYNFSSPCLVKVGTASSVIYKNADGQQANVGLASASISEEPDSYVFGLNSYSYNQTHTWGVLFEIVAEKVTGYINETVDGFNTTVTSDKLYVSGVTGYLNTVDAFGFGNVDELVVVDGEYDFGHKIVNGNSPRSDVPNRGVAFKKLSGTGTITNGDHGNKPTPVVGICDSSEFAGSINIGSGTTRPTILFCTETEISNGIGTSLGDSLVTLFTSEGNFSRIYVSAGRTTANNAVVTVPDGKTWTAVNGIVNKGELVVDGTVSCNIVNDGTLTINGTVTGTISGSGSVVVNGTVTGTVSGSGTVVVNEGATIPSFGSKRDFTGWTVDPTIPVKIAMTSEEYGKGSVSVAGADGISSITVFAPDGTTEVGAITPEEGAGTLETGVKVAGKACWIDYEMSYGSGKNGFENTGTSSSLVLQKDSGIDGSDAFTDDGMLYTYAHPYRQNLTIPSTWTAVVRCTVPNYPDAAVIIFGWNNNYIGLVAGETPKTEMRLVQYKTGYDHYVTNAVMNVQDATTAQHVYVFAVENSQTLKVYCDGSVILDKELDEPLTITSGFQIGSVLGGATGGIVRFAKNESPANTLAESVQKDARIDCVRLYDYSLSADQLAALSAEFPAVKLYEATVEADADTTWESLDWSNDWDGGNAYSKVLLTVAGDAIVELPESITAEELAFEVEPGSTLTLKGPGSLEVTRAIDAVGFTLKLADTVTFEADTTFAGNVVFGADFAKAGDGAIQLANGATVGVDAALVVTPLGTYTCAEGTVVDSAYTGEGVKLIPLTSAVVSITQSGTTLYYSDLDTAAATLMTIGDVSDDVSCVLLNGTTWPTTPQDYAGMLRTLGYYVDGDGTVTKAVARITSTPYQTLAAAVAAAEDGATVTLLLASSEEITLNKAITLSETANFSGTLTGNGTLTFAVFRNNPSITFTDWTGTIVLPEFAANGTILNKYGVTGSTVVLKGITAGWLGETSSQKMDVNPVLQLDGDVTIKGFSTSWDYTFAEITGTGAFSLDPTDNSPKSATITKVAEGFTGVITNTTVKTLTIGTLAREAGTSTDVGKKLLDTYGDVVAEALTVDDEPVDVRLVTEEDGIYVGAPIVAMIGEVPYTSLDDAVDDATDGATIIVVADNTLTGTVDIDKNLTLDLNGYTVTGAEGDKWMFEPKAAITFTIKDSSEGAAGKAYSAESKVVLAGNVACTFTLESGTLEAAGNVPVYVYGTSGGYSVVINGGKLIAGTTDGSDYCISAMYGSVTFAGGELDAEACNGFHVSSIAITGGEITVRSNGSIYNSGATATISGGTFYNVKPDETKIVSGKVAVETSTGVWTVTEVQEVPVAPGAQTEPVDTYAEAEAEAAKTVVSVPEAVAAALSDEQEVAYKALFEAKVVEVTVGETTKYAVAVELEASVASDLQTAVDAEAADLAAAAVTAAAGESGSAPVATTPGLYYVVEAGSEVDGIAPASCTLATGTSLNLTIPNKGTKGFYKLRVSVTPVDVQE